MCLHWLTKPHGRIESCMKWKARGSFSTLYSSTHSKPHSTESPERNSTFSGTQQPLVPGALFPIWNAWNTPVVYLLPISPCTRTHHSDPRIRLCELTTPNECKVFWPLLQRIWSYFISLMSYSAPSPAARTECLECGIIKAGNRSQMSSVFFQTGQMAARVLLTLLWRDNYETGHKLSFSYGLGDEDLSGKPSESSNFSILRYLTTLLNYHEALTLVWSLKSLKASLYCSY